MNKAEIKEKIIEIRRHLHMHPETAMEEYETSNEMKMPVSVS